MREVVPIDFSGDPVACGKQYSEYYQAEIAAFFTKEFDGYKYSKKFIRACRQKIKKFTPLTYKFLQGMASDSLLTLDQHILLTLHEEELYHRQLARKRPHCTTIGQTISTNTNKNAILGQNWDWSTAYLPFGSFNRFILNNKTKVLALSFPGLPICAGLNSHGLALMWSGVGYYPPLLPRVGVPTYALCFELMRFKRVSQAIRFLKNTPNAGAFAFGLADSLGNLAIVEAVPGRIFFRRVEVVHRANVFELPEAVRAAHQKLPASKKCSSLKRNRILVRLEQTKLKRSSLNSLKSSLSHKGIYIEQGYAHASLFQLIANCNAGTLHIRRWRSGENWKKLKI